MGNSSLIRLGLLVTGFGQSCRLEDHIRIASSPIETQVAVWNNEEMLRKHEPQEDVPHAVSSSPKLLKSFLFPLEISHKPSACELAFGESVFTFINELTNIEHFQVGILKEQYHVFIYK